MPLASGLTSAGRPSVSGRPSGGLTAANADAYSRTHGVLTSGRTPGGAQHRRGSRRRPKRASSSNITRTGKLGAAALGEARRPRAARRHTHGMRGYSAFVFAPFHSAAQRSADPSGNGRGLRRRYLPRSPRLLLFLMQRKRMGITTFKYPLSA